MNKNYFRAILIAVTFVAATASWICEYRAVEVAGASSWGWPIFWFSLYFIFLCLDLILFPNIISVEIIAVATFAISLIFAFTFWHFVFLLFSSLLFLSALQSIKKDFELNVKVSVWKSFHMGRMKIIFAMSLLIASQYYAMLGAMSGPKTMPKFDTTAISERLVGPILSFINPQFKSMQSDNITVDEFIAQSQEKQAAETGASDAQTQGAVLDPQVVLTQGRQQLSQMVGRNVAGNEKISDVFSSIIDQKINNFFEPQGVSDQSANTSTLIFTIVLFLTVLSLGSFLLPIWLVILMGLFWLCKKMGIVEIKKIMVEREIMV